MTTTPAQRFSALCTDVEPRLRRALVAAYGPQVGSEASADALAWAWEHFERVERMSNPAGYLWRVGQTSARRQTRRPAPSIDGPMRTPANDVAFEPALTGALAGLSARQRAAVLLVHGYGYPLSEAAILMGCRIRTLRHHLERGLARLRASLGADDG